jgi:hypothetical protein
LSPSGIPTVHSEQIFFSLKDFGNHDIWAFPPKVVMAPAFQHLTRRARNNNWALVISDYENLNPIWSEVANDKSLKILDNLGDPVLFPSKELTDFGYWKIPLKAQFRIIYHPKESKKRKKYSR